MQLTGKQIVDRGIITNYCPEGVQQQGVDVRVDTIYNLVAGCGVVPAKGKTVTPKGVQQEWGDEPILLQPGYYEIDLMEACEIPNDVVLNFKTRSSLVRCGAIVHSGQFDAGFKTDKMGCFLEVIKPFYLEQGARIAQAIVSTTWPVDAEDLYDGQWQNDIQRKSK